LDSVFAISLLCKAFSSENTQSFDFFSYCLAGSPDDAALLIFGSAWARSLQKSFLPKYYPLTVASLIAKLIGNLFIPSCNQLSPRYFQLPVSLSVEMHPPPLRHFFFFSALSFLSFPPPSSTSEFVKHASDTKALALRAATLGVSGYRFGTMILALFSLLPPLFFFLLSGVENHRFCRIYRENHRGVRPNLF